MLARKAQKEIDKWISNGKRALLVSGARQVGKTYLIRKSLQDAKQKYLEINLINHPELVEVLEKSMTVEDLVINLSAAMNYTFVKGESIVFIDEVQELTDIISRIKFWVDEGSFRYILSGSLLGVELKSLRSAPVGYLDEITMYPLDFEEFITASGVNDDTVQYLRECFEETKEVQQIVHDKMMNHFRRYLVVGGMPAAVQEYVDSGNMNEVSAIQSNIVSFYKRDFTKYEEERKRLMLTDIYDQIPSQLLKQNRRFNYSDIKKGLRYERVEDSFIWLTAAGAAIPTYNATEPRVALNQNRKSSLLKLYSSDVGLLTCQCGDAIRLKILMADEKINLGGIYENAVAQELHAHGFPTYFYNSHKKGELDFVIEKDASVVPIEVKSGKNYYEHSALTKVVENEEYDVQEAYVLTNYNTSSSGKIKNLPIYMSAFIREDTELPILEPL